MKKIMVKFLLFFLFSIQLSFANSFYKKSSLNESIDIQAINEEFSINLAKKDIVIYSKSIGKITNNLLELNSNEFLKPGFHNYINRKTKFTKNSDGTLKGQRDILFVTFSFTLKGKITKSKDKSILLFHSYNYEQAVKNAYLKIVIKKSRDGFAVTSMMLTQFKESTTEFIINRAYSDLKKKSVYLLKQLNSFSQR